MKGFTVMGPTSYVGFLCGYAWLRERIQARNTKLQFFLICMFECLLSVVIVTMLLEVEFELCFEKCSICWVL